MKSLRSGRMYKHLYIDQDVAFRINRIFSKNSYYVTFYRKNEKGTYVCMNYSEEMYVSDDQMKYYLEIGK